MISRLSDISSIVYGKSPAEVTDSDGAVPIIGTGGEYGRAYRAMFNVGIVVPRKGSLGNPQLALYPFWATDTTFAVLPTTETDTRWLYYSLLNYDLSKLNEATGVPSISRDWLSKIQFFNPGPLRQSKIADILQTIDRAIEKTEALIEKYQQIKAGLMHDLFTRGIGPDGQLRPPREQAPELYQKTPIGWIPKEWGLWSLKNIFGSRNITNGPFGSDLLTSELKREGVPVLYCQDIKPGFFERVSTSNVTQQKAAQLSFCDVRKGDILIAKVGSPPCNSCVYVEEESAVVTQDVIRIRTSSQQVSSFFSNWFNTGFGRKGVRRISIEGTRERVSLGEFKELLLPVPQFHEQIEIGSKIQTLRNFSANINKNLHKLQKQKSGLMHDLLTGKVPVQVEEPESEPEAAHV